MKKLITLLFALTLLVTFSVQAQTARVQIIHNSPDPLLDTVDININSGLLTLDDVAFRDATAFTTVPSGTAITVDLFDASGSVQLGSVSFDSLASGQTYAIIAQGVADTASFVNPDGLSTLFTLQAIAPVTEASGNANLVNLTIVHGSPNAPSVDVVARGVATLVDNVSFLGAQGAPVPNLSYTIDIADSMQNTVVASYTADLTSLGGGAAVVFASGSFGATGANAFGIWVALADGTTFPLPAAPVPARVQIIHNAADPAAATVQIDLNNGAIVLDSVDFRSATAFVDVPGGVPITVDVNTPDGITTIKSFNYDSLASGETYVIIANGVADAMNFDPNPDSESIDFDLYIYGMGQEMATNGTKADLLFFHGVTDAPTVDIVANGSVTLSDDLTYGNFDGYVAVDPITYTVAVTDAAGTTNLFAYNAPLSTATGGAAVVFASGFLNDAQGPGFGVYVTLADGSTFPLPLATGIDEVAFRAGLNVYPNPAVDQVNVQFTLEETQEMEYRVVNTLGQVVSNVNLGTVEAGTNSFNVNVSDLNSGLYLIQMNVGTDAQITKTIQVQ